MSEYMIQSIGLNIVAVLILIAVAFQYIVPSVQDMLDGIREARYERTVKQWEHAYTYIE